MSSNILEHVLPAERMRGTLFRETFDTRESVLRNRATIYGTPSIKNGITLNGTTDYVTYPLAKELEYSQQTVSVEFYPDFEANDNNLRYLVDSQQTNFRLLLIKNNANEIRTAIGTATTLIHVVALANYQAYWLRGLRNVLTFAADSSGVNNLYLNGHLISTSAAAWTPGTSSTLYVGRYNLGASGYFKGIISRVSIGNYLGTEQEHLDLWNNTTWNWPDESLVTLPMRHRDYDPVNTRTLDISGNGNHFTLGDGSTPATHPTQADGKMVFDGSDTLRLGSLVQPSGSFAVAATVAMTPTGSTQYIAQHSDAGFVDVVFALTRNRFGAFLFYVGTPGGAAYLSSPLYSYTDPHTVVGVWDGTEGFLYVDGVYAVASTSGVLTQPAGDPQPVWVGARTNGSGFLNGSVFDFRYYHKKLTPTQILDYHHKVYQQTLGSQV